jgi:hypothetical protein
MKTMNFTLVTKEGRKELRVDFDKVLAIGFAGRDQVKAMEHIHELEKLGVKAPESIECWVLPQKTKILLKKYLNEIS